MDTTGTTRVLAHYRQDATDDEKLYGLPVEPIDDEHPANCITSGPAFGGWHFPILDVDGDEPIFRVEPSKTPGHQHVFIEKPVSYAGLMKLLGVLAELDLVDRKWADLCIRQGTATVRLPENPDLLSDAMDIPF